MLTIVIALHGAIHALGVVKFFAAGDPTFALLWLVALLVLLTTVILRIARHGSWWVSALVGVVLSQGLIAFAWDNAKFGTFANVVILVPALVAAAHARFSHGVDAEIRDLLARTAATPRPVVARSDVEGLPAPVRRWLEASGVIGRERIRNVRLRQRGELRTSPDSAWMPALAVQYVSVDPPAFIWKVDATMLGVLPVAGRDKYADGRGHMLVKAASLVNVVDAADDKIDQGSMLRFLGETIWFPSAALGSDITWEPIDDTSAKATLRRGERTATAVFGINERGRVVGIRAERYLDGGPNAKLTPWVVSCTDWHTFDGIEVPSRGEVAWELATGRFAYYRWEILDVEYDRAGLYREPAARPLAGPTTTPQEARP